jgi:hypothetical protein
MMNVLRESQSLEGSSIRPMTLPGPSGRDGGFRARARDQFQGRHSPRRLTEWLAIPAMTSASRQPAHCDASQLNLSD